MALLVLVGGGGGGEETVDAGASDGMVACDPVGQSGCGAGMKCTFVDPEGDGFETACRAAGTVAEGMTCVRGGGFGDDDCAAGSFCTFIGVLPPAQGGTRVCRAICGVGAACDGGQTCAQLVDAPMKAGMCGPSCAPFAGTCGDGMTCAELWTGLGGDFDLFAVCRPPGATGAGQACGADSDCVADHTCLELPGAPVVCRPLCDSTHPCASGSCFEADGGFGACV